MKVSVKHKDTPSTGKGYFIKRLVPELKKLGVEVTDDMMAGADIALHVGRVHEKDNARRRVIRVGPASVETGKNYKAINKAKWKSVKKCDAVIYQSVYSKKVYHHFVGKPKCLEAVVLNGAPVQTFSRHQTPYEYNFLACTRRWHPNKRLKWTIKAFEAANIPNSRLWVAGDISMTKYHGKPHRGNISFLGIVTQQELGRLRVLCNAHIHLTYLDAAPNAVVESLVLGCPVICGNQGGTHELVRDSGYVIDDKPFKFSPIDLNKPPKASFEQVARALREVCVHPKTVDSEHVRIETIAKQYVEVFERVRHS